MNDDLLCQKSQSNKVALLQDLPLALKYQVIIMLKISSFLVTLQQCAQAHYSLLLVRNI